MAVQTETNQQAISQTTDEVFLGAAAARRAEAIGSLEQDKTSDLRMIAGTIATQHEVEEAFEAGATIDDNYKGGHR